MKATCLIGIFVAACWGGGCVTATNYSDANIATLRPAALHGFLLDDSHHAIRGLIIDYGPDGSAFHPLPTESVFIPTDQFGHPVAPFAVSDPKFPERPRMMNRSFKHPTMRPLAEPTTRPSQWPTTRAVRPPFHYLSEEQEAALSRIRFTEADFEEGRRMLHSPNFSMTDPATGRSWSINTVPTDRPYERLVVCEKSPLRRLFVIALPTQQPRPKQEIDAARARAFALTPLTLVEDVMVVPAFTLFLFVVWRE